jgi:hypothetical protein
MRKAVFGLVTAFITTLAMFCVAEIGVRMLNGTKPRFALFPRYHTDVKYGQFTIRRIRPNIEFWHTSVDGSWKFVTNKQGFRNDRDFSYEKPKGTIRVLSLGDSQTQGYEVGQDQTFSAVAAKYLSQRGYSIEVMNAGVSGFSTAEEVVLLENEGIRYRPDFVILGFFANDFEDNLKADLFKLQDDGTLTVNKFEHIPGVRIQNAIYDVPGIKFLSENSYFYSLVFNTVWDAVKDRAANRATEYAVPTKQEFSQHQTALGLALLKRMGDFCHEHQAKFIILDIPRMEGQRDFASSFPTSVLPSVKPLADGYIDSPALLADYQRVVEVHRPHGHRHISDFTHAVLGVAAAKKIEQFLAAPRS